MSSLARLSLLKSKAFLLITSTDIDDELIRLLEGTTDLVNQLTSRQLVRTQYTWERYTGDNSDTLYLRQWPVSVVVTIKVWDGTDSFDVLDETHYEVIDERYVQYPKLGQRTNAIYSGWLSSYKNGIQVTYMAGYNTTGSEVLNMLDSFPVPSALEYAVTKLAALAWTLGKKGGSRLGLLSLAHGGTSIAVDKYEQGIPKDVMDVIMSYTRLEL